nr:hypothetical protein [Streptomyces bathyalis]
MEQEQFLKKLPMPLARLLATILPISHLLLFKPLQDISAPEPQLRTFTTPELVSNEPKLWGITVNPSKGHIQHFGGLPSRQHLLRHHS